MRENSTLRIDPPEVLERVRRSVIQRTAGRVAGLKVEWAGERLVLSGGTETYHLKQLALCGVRDVIGRHSEVPISLNLAVGVDAQLPTS